MTMTDTPQLSQEQQRPSRLPSVIFRAWNSINTVFETRRIELVTVMTALVVMTHSLFTVDDVRTVLMFAALVVPAVRRFGPFWIGVGIFRFFSQVPQHWPSLDNHQHLINWWCLGLGFALMASQSEEAIRRLARIMLGLCFLFATIWKIRSPDFLNGDFFTWTFATDSRLRAFAETFLGLPEGAQRMNGDALRLLELGAAGGSEPIVTGSRLHIAAIITSWYTVVIEGSIAVFYLVPERFRVARWGHWALLVFIVTVYPIAPVVGFALILMTMSVAALSTSAQGSNRRWIAIASVLFVVLPLFGRFEDLFAALG
jgi:hypothetical protein